MAQFNGFGNSEKFPFSIERKPTDSDDFYRGICQGAKVVYEMLKSGIFEDSSIPVTYFSKESNRGMCCDWCMEDNTDEENEDFEDDAYEAGFDDGFRHGYQSACDDTKSDIFIDTEKICKLDQLHNEILELGRRLHPAHIDMLNTIVKRVTDLKYEVAKEAVDDFLGYI